MANVNPPGSRNRGRRRADRGQLLFIAGLLLAVTFVLLAVLLNSVIYAENLGSRGADIGGDDPVEYETAALGAGEEFLASVNRGAETGTDHGDLERNFTAAMDSWNVQSRNHSIRDGDYSRVTVDGFVRGTQVSAEGTTFENDSNVENWTLLSGGVHVRNYTIDIDDLHATGPADAFGLVVTNGSDEWRMDIYDGRVRTEENGAEIGQCSVSGPESIDFAAGTVDGADCDVATFGGDLEPPYDAVSYVNGSRIEGNYSFVTDADVHGSPDYDTRRGLYAANLTLEYETSRIEYNSTVRVAPGETRG